MAEHDMHSRMSVAEIRGWLRKVLQRFGMFPADSNALIDRLLEAEIRGRPEHGLRIVSDIVAAIDLGDIDPRARLLTVSDLPALAILDGGTGVGQVGASLAMQLAIEKARTSGLAQVAIRNSQPCADVAGIAELAAQAGCFGLCVTNSGRAQYAVSTESPWLTESPLAWSIPGSASEVWTFQQRFTADDVASATAGSPILMQSLWMLLQTAGLTNSRLPEEKKKASPFGAGAEHCCVAVSLATLEPLESMFRWIHAHRSQLGDRVQQISLTEEPDSLALSTETCQRLQETSDSTRTPLPASVWQES